MQLNNLEEILKEMVHRLPNGAIDIEYNKEAGHYQPVALVAEKKEDNTVWVSEQSKQKAIEDNKMWSIRIRGNNKIEKAVYARSLDEIFDYLELSKYKELSYVMMQAMLYTLKDENSSSHLVYEKFASNPFNDDKEEFNLIDAQYYWYLKNYTNSANSFTQFYDKQIYDVFKRNELHMFFDIFELYNKIQEFNHKEIHTTRMSRNKI